MVLSLTALWPDVTVSITNRRVAGWRDRSIRVMLATVSMYGDLQGIAGKSLKEIEGLELKSLEGPSGEREESIGQ